VYYWFVVLVLGGFYKGGCFALVGALFCSRFVVVLAVGGLC
jgi:hypothetical protein